MVEKFRDRVAHALVWTTDQIQPGLGKSQTRINDMYLDDIQKHVGRGSQEVLPRYAFRMYYLPNDSGKSEIAVDKKYFGIFVLLDDGYIVARDHGWARTIVEGCEIAGCKAEPVTASIKEKKAAAFRITGSANALYVLDPVIDGGQGKQSAVRDRIVSRINGEVQAGPGQRDAPGPVHTAVMRLLAIDDDSSDPRDPKLGADGLLRMDDGEDLLNQGRHNIVVSRHQPVAYGNGWRQMQGFSIPAEVWITSRRVAVSWPDWMQDPASAVMVERRRRAGYPDATDGLVVAGHLTWAWISSIYVGSSDQAPGAASLEFQATDRDTPVRIRILGFDTAEAERLMHAAAVAVAAYRTDTDDSLTADERVTLEAIRDGRGEVEKLSWGLTIALPSSFKIGKDSPPI